MQPEDADEAGTDTEWVWMLPSSLDAPALARLRLRRHASHLPAATLDDALILMTELVTNAVLHGGPPITVSVTFESASLTVAVHDNGAELPLTSVSLPAGIHTHGRGLALVDAIANHWDITPDQPPPGKTVTFELRLR